MNFRGITIVTFIFFVGISTTMSQEDGILCSSGTCELGYRCVVQKPKTGHQSQTKCVATCQVIDCPPDTTCIDEKTKYGYVEPECVSTKQQCGPKPTNPCAATSCITGATCKNIGCKAVCVLPKARKD